MGWPSKFNSWIPRPRLKTIRGRRDNVFLIMDQSLVYGRNHSLRELGQANKTTIILLVSYMTREHMETLAEVAGYIVRGSIGVLPQDATNFRERSLILRPVIDPRISLRRKRNAMATYHNLVPRLLRPYNLNRAVVLSNRSGEQ
jgi:hypothetical protein